jgi:hypothetical protein
LAALVAPHLGARETRCKGSGRVKFIHGLANLSLAIPSSGVRLMQDEATNTALLASGDYRCNTGP